MPIQAELWQDCRDWRERNEWGPGTKAPQNPNPVEPSGTLQNLTASFSNKQIDDPEGEWDGLHM